MFVLEAIKCKQNREYGPISTMSLALLSPSPPLLISCSLTIIKNCFCFGCDSVLTLLLTFHPCLQTSSSPLFEISSPWCLIFCPWSSTFSLIFSSTSSSSSSSPLCHSPSLLGSDLTRCWPSCFCVMDSEIQIFHFQMTCIWLLAYRLFNFVLFQPGVVLVANVC